MTSTISCARVLLLPDKPSSNSLFLTTSSTRIYRCKDGDVFDLSRLSFLFDATRQDAK